MATAAASRAARRAAPQRARRRRSARRPAPIQWHRVGRLALLATLAAIVLLYIPPLMHLVQQRSTAAAGRAQLHELQQEHDRLQTRLHELSTPAGVGAAARALGMVKAGERPYVIEGGLPPAR